MNNISDNKQKNNGQKLLIFVYIIYIFYGGIFIAHQSYYSPYDIIQLFSGH